MIEKASKKAVRGSEIKLPLVRIKVTFALIRTSFVLNDDPYTHFCIYRFLYTLGFTSGKSQYTFLLVFVLGTTSIVLPGCCRSFRNIAF